MKNVRRITADWADVDHPISKLDKRSTAICGRMVYTVRYHKGLPFDRNAQISKVMQYEVDQLLVVLFTDALDKGL